MFEPNLFNGGEGSDDGTFVPFTDILFNALLGFTVMVFIAFSLIRPDAKSGAVDVKAEMIITVSWPDHSPDDIDTYLEDPAGHIVWYNTREAGLIHLDRDDRGQYRDTITVGGKQIDYPLNQETVTVRGLVPGEYVLNVFYYLTQDQLSVPVTVKVEKINPVVKVVYISTLDLAKQGDEKTVVRFTLDADGNVADLNQRPKSLIAELKK